MFRDAVFTRGVMLAFLSSVGLLGTTFLLPLFFQLVRGADAASSGFLVVPFLLFSVIGAFSGGQLARRLGRTKAIVVAGFSAASFGFAALTLVGPATPLAAVLIAMAVVGVGIGVCMPNVLVMVQNAADRRDVGTATGALLFLRSMGGAFGSTLVGALLASGFAARLREKGITAHLDLGDIRQHGAGLQAVDPALMPHVQEALAGAFHLAFLACAVAMTAALGVAMGLRDLPLRSSSADEPQPEPAALAH
jgi:MFS family permease